jgi:two-component system response regulator AtoC
MTQTQTERASAPRVLVVDDDAAVSRVLGALLKQAGIEATIASSGEQALAVLAAQPVDVVVTDLKMPGMSGLDLLGKTQEQWPETPVVLITAHGTVATAVEAMKRGAADFVQKPFERDEILYVVKKALASARHEEARPSRLPAAAQGTTLLGSSPAMRECDERLSRAARGVASVLLRGRERHRQGAGRARPARAQRPPRRAVRGGPRRGAARDAAGERAVRPREGRFTGAVARKPGRVELADGGTLFLDELGDLPPAVQVKLLRVVQERQFERLGGTQTLKVDVRFVAATHRDLEAMVKAGAFREDLFFRLNVISIRLPPLRERPGDVAELARHFCARLGLANGRPDAQLEDDAVALLSQQTWPGNVRQLQNFVERLVVMSETPRVGASFVARELAAQAPMAAPLAGAAAGRAAEDSPPYGPGASASAFAFASPASTPNGGGGGGDLQTLEARRREAERRRCWRRCARPTTTARSPRASSAWAGARSTTSSASWDRVGPMDHLSLRDWVTLVSCAGQLALATLALTRLSRSPLALPLALLCLDVFAMNGADVANAFLWAQGPQQREWVWADAVAASLLTPLAFYLVLAFVGKRRAWRIPMAAAWLYYGGIAAFCATAFFGVQAARDFAGNRPWSYALLPGAALFLPAVAVLLARHLREDPSTLEKARTWLLVGAYALGFAGNVADLLANTGVEAPRLGTLGTLLATLVLSGLTLRTGLLERRVPWLLGANALVAALVQLFVYLGVFHYFGGQQALLVLALGTVALALLPVLVLMSRSAAAHRQRLEYHATLGRFSAQMAHDLRNPLTAIKGAAQFLAEACERGEPPPDAREMLQVIVDQADRLTKVVSDYQRMGRVEPKPKPVDLNELVEGVVGRRGWASPRA